MLEETGLAYEPHRIDISANESHDPAFLALNPNGKIPAIYDPNGPGGRSLALFESGAILIYLAEKSGQFLSTDPHTRYETIQWLMGSEEHTSELQSLMRISYAVFCLTQKNTTHNKQ